MYRWRATFNAYVYMFYLGFHKFYIGFDAMQGHRGAILGAPESFHHQAVLLQKRRSYK